MSTKVQLQGGAFQDVQGNKLANGYLLMELSQDAAVSSPTAQIAAGYTIKIKLDVNGNVDTSTLQYVWPNDVLSPANTFYNVSGYTANGELVWGPNAQQVLSSPSPYDIGAWKPNVSNTSAPRLNTNYDIGIFFPGTPANAQVMLLLQFTRGVIYPANFAGSTALCGINPTASVTFTIYKNGVSIGTLILSTAGTATFTASAVSFNATDTMKIVGPATADLTLANIGMVFAGTLSS